MSNPSWKTLLKTTHVLFDDKREVLAQLVPTSRHSDTYRLYIGTEPFVYVRGLEQTKQMLNKTLKI